MKITKRQLLKIIREEKAKSTKKYDDDPALTGGQDKLPDDLQKAIIDKKGKNESALRNCLKVTKSQLRRIIREEAGKVKSTPVDLAISDADFVKSLRNDAGDIAAAVPNKLNDDFARALKALQAMAEHDTSKFSTVLNMIEQYAETAMKKDQKG